MTPFWWGFFLGAFVGQLVFLLLCYIVLYWNKQ